MHVRVMLFALIAAGIAVCLNPGVPGGTSRAPTVTPRAATEVVARLAALRGDRAAQGLFGQARRGEQMKSACIDGFRGACFAPGTSDEVIQGVSSFLISQWELQQAQNPAAREEGIAYFVTTGWSSQGTPIALTWSMVPDGLFIPSGVGEPGASSTLFNSMDLKFGGNRALWIQRLTQSFDRWAAVSGLTFTRVTNGTDDWDDGASWGTGNGAQRGHIRISSKTIDGSNNTLAYADFPSGGDIVLDSGENWQSSSNSHRFLRNVMMHELGHSLGMFHVCPLASTRLMEPLLITSFDGPRHDDIRAAHRLYGDADEPNDTSGTATDLGTLGAGGTINRGTLPNPTTGSNPANSSSLCLDAQADVDFYKFAITGSRTVSITITPVGQTYDNSQQNGNGSCSSGNSINSQSFGNLAVQLRDTNGSTVLASADVNPAGSPETISSFTLTAAGTYFVRVFTASSLTQSQMYTLSVTATATCVQPSITSQPDSETVCVGSPVTFSVTATGTEPLSYQWRKGGVDIGGANGSSLNIASASVGDVGNYTVFISNACGNTTSAIASLSVQNPPGIVTQPTSAIACVGADAVFTVLASGGGLEYQWRKGGIDISGANSATLDKFDVQTSDGGSYDCVVTNSCGSITTNSVNLTVRTPPVIVTHPTSEAACVGDFISLSVVAGGSTPRTFQWRKGGNPIDGATDSILDFVPVSAADAGNYDCVVTNACGSATTNTATITVLAATVISDHPDPVNVCTGGMASFSVTATGQGTLSYQWKRGVTNVGTNSPSLTINPVGPGDAGNYTCVVTGECGPATSNAAALTISTGPSISVHPSNATPCVGQPASFSVTASDVTGYQWRKNTNPIGGANGPSYSIPSVVAGDVGNYDCVVSNACGSVTSNAASLTISSGPSISVHPANASVCSGQPASFSVTASDVTGYQWRKNTNPIGGANGPSYSIPSAVVGDAGSYDCVVSNACGSVTSNAATLAVDAGPQITLHPASATGCQNGQLTLTIAATGSPVPTFQWRKGAADIGGETGTSLTIDPVSAADAGSYDCVVSNACGSVTSNVAVVTVRLKADANCDGVVNNFDIDAFVVAIVSGQSAWEALYSCDYVCANDVSRDGVVNNFDIDPFVQCIVSGECP
ncbi:MAG: immunoglobulin domain-containing protein [Phycisphaerales bacterium]|nr:immunoglobulin domain-containing protein [Phycisphaerales bacterium]